MLNFGLVLFAQRTRIHNYFLHEHQYSVDVIEDKLYISDFLVKHHKMRKLNYYFFDFLF